MTASERDREDSRAHGEAVPLGTESTVTSLGLAGGMGVSSVLKWYAVHTRSRHEKMVHRQILVSTLEPFLPLRQERRRWKDRWKWVEFPMFPGYLFVRGKEDELKELWRTKGVVQVLGNGWDHPSPVPDEQIHRVRALVDSRVQVEPCPYLKRGVLVRVLRGPLMGLHGIFVQRKNLDRIVIAVDLIGKAVATEIDVGDVEPI